MQIKGDFLLVEGNHVDKRETATATTASETQAEPGMDASSNKQINQKKGAEAVDGAAESKPATARSSANGESNGMDRKDNHSANSEQKGDDLSKPGEKYSSNVKPVGKHFLSSNVCCVFPKTCLCKHVRLVCRKTIRISRQAKPTQSSPNQPRKLTMSPPTRSLLPRPRMARKPPRKVRTTKKERLMRRLLSADVVDLQRVLRIVLRRTPRMTRRRRANQDARPSKPKSPNQMTIPKMRTWRRTMRASPPAISRRKIVTQTRRRKRRAPPKGKVGAVEGRSEVDLRRRKLALQVTFRYQKRNCE